MNEGYGPDVSVLSYRGTSPVIPESVFLAPGARVIGDVVLGEECGVWFNVLIRGDIHRIRVGDRTNVQDLSVLHVTAETGPLTIGGGVTIGHGVTLHGCTVDDFALIGIGAIVLDGAYVEHHAMVAAGAVVTPGTRVETGTLYAGIPARPLRKLTDEEYAHLAVSADRYVDYAREYRTGAQAEVPTDKEAWL